MQKQSGFAVLETLLLVVVLGLIGGTGYYVWHSKQSTDKTLQNTNAVSTVPTITKKTPNTPTQTTTAGYLAIKEWGIKLPLSTEISDATYEFENGYAYLSTKSLSGTDYGLEKDNLGAVGMFRFTADEKDPTSDALWLSETGDTAGHVGKYYFGGIASKPGEQPESVADKASAVITAFDTAIKNAQAE